MSGIWSKGPDVTLWDLIAEVVSGIEPRELDRSVRVVSDGGVFELKIIDFASDDRGFILVVEPPSGEWHRPDECALVTVIEEARS